ncbi:MAG: signal recognition particle-docking protein FtsY [Oscillospiraceae bacterium]|nr:signal recognition particle-docking protein FtsY [Oscillospiraceae bacterium]
MGLFSKIKEGLKKTKDSMMKKVESVINSFVKIDENLFEELEETLIMSDIGYNTSVFICSELRKKVKETGTKDANNVKKLLKDIISNILNTQDEEVIDEKKIIVLIGVNGVGKTTTIGKLSNIYKTEGKKVLIAAADTFRAAAIEQLDVWAKRSDVDIIKHKNGSDPASVIFDSIISGKSKNYDIILCDTAGRLHNKNNLMKELEKVNRIIDREKGEYKKEILLVLDATTGQNAINQAIEFKEVADITGIVLTKLDGTAKGGIVIPIKYDIGIPIKYVGVGEQLDDLQIFDANEFTDGLFD